jgi:predicted extracellular nuclease
VGLVDYSRDRFRVLPEQLETAPRRSRAPSRSGSGGDTVVATWNLENLFDLVDDPERQDGSSTPSPAELEVRLVKLARAIERELRLPDLLVVQEVETRALLQELGDRVNAAAGTAYVATSFESSDRRGIQVGLLWDAHRLELLEAAPLAGPEVEAAFGALGASPGREPLAARFRIGDRELTVVANHFRSKRGDHPLLGALRPFPRPSEVPRKAQARAVRAFVERLLERDPAALVLVAGDLNDFEFGEPGEGADHPLAILEGPEGPTRLTNLLRLERESERFTFLFEGNAQALDHMLVSPALLERSVGADVLHFNAGQPAALAADPSLAARSSDHDPLEGRFRLRGARARDSARSAR